MVLPFFNSRPVSFLHLGRMLSVHKIPPRMVLPFFNSRPLSSHIRPALPFSFCLGPPRCFLLCCFLGTPFFQSPVPFFLLPQCSCLSVSLGPFRRFPPLCLFNCSLPLRLQLLLCL